MLRLESSPDVLADVGAVLETFADEIRGAIRVAEQQLDEVAYADGWVSSPATRSTIAAAEAKAAALADSMDAIRWAIRQASDGYADADRRSAARQGAIPW
jgi:uncharacterized protein YukE